MVQGITIYAKQANMDLITSMHTIEVNIQEIQSKSTMSEIRVPSICVSI